MNRFISIVVLALLSVSFAFSAEKKLVDCKANVVKDKSYFGEFLNENFPEVTLVHDKYNDYTVGIGILSYSTRDSHNVEVTMKNNRVKTVLVEVQNSPSAYAIGYSKSKKSWLLVGTKDRLPLGGKKVKWDVISTLTCK